MKKPNEIVILNFQSRLINNYLEKGLFIIENDSKHLSILPNDTKLIIYAHDALKQILLWQKHTNLLCIKHHKEIAHTV